jgi:hypothetical protein
MLYVCSSPFTAALENFPFARRSCDAAKAWLRQAGFGRPYSEGANTRIRKRTERERGKRKTFMISSCLLLVSVPRSCFSFCLLLLFCPDSLPAFVEKA